MKIIGIGNALIDVLIQGVEDKLLREMKLLRGGMQLIDDESEKQITAHVASLRSSIATGGSASNTILALAHLGIPTGFIGRVGSDEMGKLFLRKCHERGTETRIFTGSGLTGIAHTFISYDGERTFATHLGEAALLQSDDITADLLKGYDLLHIEGYLVQNHALIETVAQQAKAQGMKISLDLASYNVVNENLDFFRRFVTDYVDIIFGNEEESAAFTYGKEPEEALRELGSLCDIAVVKLGKQGSYGMQNGEIAHAPGTTNNLIDTTAAGDFFAGGFLYGYANGLPLQKCLKTGALLSSHVIQVVGTQIADQTWATIYRNLAHI